MRISMIAVGERMPKWLQTGFDDYCSRLPREWRLQLIEIVPAKRGKTSTSRQWLQQEAERILAKLPATAQAIALDNRGSQWSTEQLAEQISHWRQDSSEIAFIIGGPDGLNERVLQRCQQRWSLSKLTFPHMLVRTLIAEQLYRAWSILCNHPYHRA